MSLEDFFLISKRHGSKSFILIVWHLFFFNADLVGLYHFKIPFLSIKLEFVIRLIALRLCLRLCLLIYKK